MTTCLIVIQAGNEGIAIDQIPLLRSQDEAERAVAGILQLALTAAGDYIAWQARNSLTIEGKNIEPLVRKAIAESEFANLRQIMKDAGYSLPDE